MTVIEIDHREQASGLAELLKVHQHLHLNFRHLPVGDYWIGGIVIERKSRSDLFHSLIDGRLYRQLDALRLSSHRPVLFVEGDTPQALVQLAPGAMRGLVSAITVGYRIPIIWSKGIDDSARWIVSLARRPQAGSLGKVRPAAIKPDRLRDQQLFLLSSLPGIGRLRAIKLLEKFGTVGSVLNAGVDELCEVDGIGPYQSAGIFMVAQREWESRNNPVSQVANSVVTLPNEAATPCETQVVPPSNSVEDVAAEAYSGFQKSRT